MVDQDEGRARQIDEEARNAEAADEGQAEEVAVAQQEAVAGERAAERAVDAMLGRPRLLERGRQQDRGEQRRARHRPEHGAPAETLDDEAAGQRRQDRRHAEHQHQQRHQPRRFGAGVQVAHDGARHHHAGAGAEPLQEAEGDQPFDVGRQRRADAADREQRQADIERRLAADHVGDRADDDLAETHRQEEDQQAHLHGGGAGAEILADRRQRRQIHVDGEGADGRQKAEHDRDAEEFGRHDMLLSKSGFRQTGGVQPRTFDRNANSRLLPGSNSLCLYVQFFRQTCLIRQSASILIFDDY